MSTSDAIRRLGREGVPTAEIARRLGIRYQHAYNVLNAGGSRARSRSDAAGEVTSVPPSIAKPPLSVSTLLTAGFVLSGRWILSTSGELELDQALPKDVGVYAFAKESVVLYVGVATMGLAKRLYFYRKPGRTQLTSIRLNSILKTELLAIACIEIYTAIPDDLEWNGLPVHGSAGLELGLIKKYSLPWNMRSAG